MLVEGLIQDVLILYVRVYFLPFGDEIVGERQGSYTW